MLHLHLYDFLAVAGADDLLDQSRQAAEQMATDWENNWATIITPTGGLYAALADLGETIAVCCFFFWGITIVKDFVNNGSTAFLHELIWPMTLVLLLAGNGTILADLTIGMREVLHNKNQELLGQVSNSFSLKEAYEKAKGNGVVIISEATSSWRSSQILVWRLLWLK